MEDTETPNYSARRTQNDEGIYELKLYVAGNNKKSQLALASLKEICSRYLAGKCHIEVIDLKKNPDLARADQIIAVPTLTIKNYSRRIVGDLSDQKKILEALGLETFNFINAANEKGPVEKTSREESKTHVVTNKRSKGDLQPYIGSGLCRQRFQSLDKSLFSLFHSPC